MEAPAFWLFVGASLVLIATPGQDMLYVVTRSLAQGRLAGLASAVGVCLGLLGHTALAALGVGAILMASEQLFFALKIAGALYLVYLGAKLMLSRPAQAIAHGETARLSLPTMVWQGMVSNLTNPKIVLFYFAFMPQFVDPASASPTRDLALLGVIYALLALPIKAGVGLAAGSLSERVLKNPSALTWMNRASGAVIVGLGIRLAAADR